MTLILGAHMSIGRGFLAAAHETVERYDANAMQCFLRSPRGGAAKPIDTLNARMFREYNKQHGVTVVVHSPYVLNLSKPYAVAPWATEIYIDDLKRCDILGIRGAIVHMGKALDGPRELAMETMAENVRRILKETKKLNAQIIIENTAGQGSEIGSTFEEIGELSRCIGADTRLFFCFDTAHAFAAGYDIATKKGWADTQKAVEKTIGWDRVSCIQLNDSKKPLGSHVDRHENIGKGLIGAEGLLRVVRFARKHSIPLLLETPLNSDGEGHAQDIVRIRSEL